MLAGQGSSLLLQLGYFILLARILGAKEYGVFIGASATVTILMPFSALGSGLIFMRYVGPDASRFPEYWGNVISSIAVAGTAATLLLWAIAPHVLDPSSASIILPVAIANCICVPFVLCVGQVFQTFEQLKITSILNFLVNLLRLGAVLALAVVARKGTAEQWAEYSLGASVVGVVIGVTLVTRRFGRPQFSRHIFRKRAGEGFGFSFAGSTQSIYNDVDKTVLSHYGMNAQNGIYTLAYRIVDMATMPIGALDAAALPRFFRQSAEGIRSVRHLATRLTIRACLIGLAVSACLFVGAFVVPHLAGKSFAEATVALRWLCLLVVFRAIHQLSGSALTGIGLQNYRTAIQLAAAAVNLGLNLALIPRFGWLGAAWSSLLTDGALAIGNFITLHRIRDRRTTSMA